jgi:hypothetical protein
MTKQHSFSKEDLVILNNSLNEVLNGFPVADFQGKLGTGKKQAEALLERVKAAGSHGLELDHASAQVLAKAIGLCVEELGGEFSTRVGYDVADAQKLAAQLAKE